MYTGLDYKFSFCIWIDTNRTHVHDFDQYIFVKLYDFLSELSIVWINFILKLIKYLNNHWANLPVAEKYAKQMKDSNQVQTSDKVSLMQKDFLLYKKTCPPDYTPHKLFSTGSNKSTFAFIFRIILNRGYIVWILSHFSQLLQLTN